MVANNKIHSLLFKNWFCISGRASRKEYICRIMLFLITGFPLNDFLSFNSSLPNTPFYIIFSLIFVVITCLILALTVTQIFLVTHRRLHDLNASGWWQLITFIPLGQLMMIGFIFFKGTDGPNKYGDPPKY